MESRTKEFVWTAKLSKKDKVAKWGGDKEGILEQITLKLAVLGPGAVKGERNLVQVTTFDSEQKKISACISALTVGLKEDQQLGDLTLFPPAHFTLIEGSGPVHIVGNHVVLDEDDLSDEEDLSEFDEDEIEDLREKLKTKGLKNEKGDAPVKSKKGKVNEEEEDDEDLDEEDDEEETAPSKKKKNAFIQAEAEEDDDDFEDMEDDSEEEDDDDEEVLEQTTSKKRKLKNGKGSRLEPQKKKPAVEKMTSPDRGSKNVMTEQKTPKSQKDVPRTPKSEKKTPSKVKAPTSVEEVKAAIKKYPGGKPRKEDKFLNWIAVQFKVTDDLWKGELWKWHKKEIGL